MQEIPSGFDGADERAVIDELTVQGVGINDIVARYGTPLYLYDGAELTRRLGDLHRLMHPRLEFFYSLKANPNVSICALLHRCGARAEVSSMAELLTALRAGVPPADILFLGPGKSRAEIMASLDHQIFALICESFGELEMIDALAAERGITASVALRVNPDFAVKGSGLTMGGRPRQFGIDERQLFAEPGMAKRYPNVRLMGVQVYLGTRILSEDAVAENTTRIFELADRLAAELRFPLELADIGGGLGVAYFAGERDLDLDSLAARLTPVAEAFAARHPETRLVMELGRYLTATAGVYVTSVRYVKSSLGERFVVADGGSNHHMAAVGIGSFARRNFPIRLLNRMSEPPSGEWNLTGPLCTPNDTLGKNVPLPDVRPGDLIGVLRSGAYGPTASPVHFLSHGYPAEVLVHDGRPCLIRRRDTPEDLLGRQVLHDFDPAGGRPMPADGHEGTGRQW